MQLQVSNVSIHYGDVKAVNQVSLRLEPGEIACLLGPSGCGKTSLLRAVAGFEVPAAGSIQLANEFVFNDTVRVPAEQRQVGMVFQDFALFPHLRVVDNVAFGLKQGCPRGQRLSNHDIQQRVSDLLDLLGIADYANAYPHELSGGQQQRVALARAIAPRPRILLLDEPFSSLDVELREQLVCDVRQLLKQHNITALMVTHDQQEAFAMADTIGVMQGGQLHQWDTAHGLYYHPASRFVAGFIGASTFIQAEINAQQQLQCELGVLDVKLDDLKAGYEVQVRPECLVYDPEGTCELPIINKQFQPQGYLYQLRLTDGGVLNCMADHHIDKAVGDTLSMTVALDKLAAFKREA